ncbi:MAG: glycosyltransferase family 39 protein [Lentisphaeria bacterium]|nr:glycosyltransferase family 39 protein [Lentisphaeria bacterium]
MNKVIAFWNSLRFSEKFFILFLVFSAFFWVLVPATYHTSLHYDPAETLMWGSSFNWGSSKHPPMAGIMLYHFCKLFSFQNFAIFLASQICMSIGFIYIWKLARCFFDRDAGVMATLLITFYFFYNYELQRFNANTPHLLFMPMMCYHFYTGVKNNKWKDWLLLAVAGAGACLSKYSAGVLFFSFAIYLLCGKETRKCFLNVKAYISGILFLLLMAPHILHLFRTEFLVFRYISEGKSQSLGYFEQLFAIAGAVIGPLACMGIAAWLIFALAAKRFFIFRDMKKTVINREGAKYSLAIIGGQGIFLLLMGICGHRVELIWTYPMFLSAGILIMSFMPQPDNRTVKVFACTTLSWAVFLLLFPLIYYNFTTGYRYHLKKEELRRSAEEFYHKHTGKKIAFISGKIWYSSMLQNTFSYSVKAAPMSDPILLSLHRNIINGRDVLLAVRNKEDYLNIKSILKSRSGKIIWKKIQIPYRSRFGKKKIFSCHFGIVKDAFLDEMIQEEK